MSLCTRFGLLVALGLSCVLASGTVSATGMPDRWQDTRTGWSYFLDIHNNDIQPHIDSGQRVFSMQRVRPDHAAIIAVSNSGSYAYPGTQVVLNRTPSQLSSFLNSNNRRIIDLTARPGDSPTFSAITVPNSGTTAAGWGYLINTDRATIDNWIANASPALRLIDIDSYLQGSTRVYSAVAIANTGANAMGWWYYWNLSPAQITERLTQNNARLVSISVEREPTILNPTPRFNVVMVANPPGSAWWWYSGLSNEQLTAVIGENGARLTALTRYTDALDQPRWAVAMVDNTNAETRRIRNSFRQIVPEGVFGMMAKRVGGAVLTELAADFAFEPASAIKIVHAARAMRGIQVGIETLQSPVTLAYRTSSGNSCPVSTSLTYPTLETSIFETLYNSSNAHTAALSDRYGRGALNAFAEAYGLTNTHLDQFHRIGCCGETRDYMNRMSARDAVLFYERIADGTVLNEFHRYELFGRTRNSDNSGSGERQRITGIIDEEAAATTALSPSELRQFTRETYAAWKGGSYNCCNWRQTSSEPCRVFRTMAGWITIPFRSTLLPGAPIQRREYTAAVFLHDASTNVNPDSLNRLYDFQWEQLRVPIRQALGTWNQSSDTVFWQGFD